MKAKQPVATVTFAEQIGLLRRAMRRALIKRLAAESDRPLNQLLALRSIARKEVTTQVELATRLLIDAPAANRLVAQLERDGLILRLQGKDRRQMRLKVTRSATAEIRAIRVGLEWLDAKMIRLVGAARFKTAMGSLTRLRLGLSEL